MERRLITLDLREVDLLVHLHWTASRNWTNIKGLKTQRFKEGSLLGLLETMDRAGARRRYRGVNPITAD